ncbi:MAG TPA: PilZ domain-containing protein [Holophaga sp.]|nr:PilZ domain-containing protein [Holophaga sp.]
MGATTITSDAEIHRILDAACSDRELLILVTPYMRFESNFLALEEGAFHARITMSVEEATYGLRSAGLHFRFPSAQRFLDGPTRLLGFGLLEGRRTLRLAIPKAIQDDEQRRAYRVDRVGKVAVTFSTARFELKSGSLGNLSTSGARILSAQESLESLFKVEDSIAVSIPLNEAIQINGRAVVRWVQGKVMGVEFKPSLEGDVLTNLSRWVFQRREEDKDRVGSAAVEAAPPVERTPGLVLVSPSQELEDSLRTLLAELPPLTRVAPTLQAVREAAAARPSLVLFHVQEAGLDGRRRLKLLVETMGGRVPFVLLGTQVEQSALFDLGNEFKAAAVYDLGPKPSSFFLRLVQGILRRPAAKPDGP